MVKYWQKMCRTFAACSMNNKMFHSKEAFLSPQLFVHLAENLSLKSFEHLWLYIFRSYQVFLQNCIPLSIPKNEEYPHLKKQLLWETTLLNSLRYRLLIFIWSIFGIDCIPTGILNIPRHPYASETLLYSFRCVSNSVVAIIRLKNNHFVTHLQLPINLLHFFIKNNHISFELTHWSNGIIFKH